ncbi:MAG: GNAT family N-acetyltransferase [Maribacter sp.]|nr:GNAT family N-acetyltransferase [Maribacter sp.]
MLLREMQHTDWDSIASIYAEGIATGFATFKTRIPTYEDWDKAHLNTCRIVVADNKTILGWAALSPVSSRCVYGGVAEVSLYVAKNHFRKGVGKMLMQKLITESEKEGYWTLQAGIFPENKGSIALHKKVGFRYIGKRERVGKLEGIWKDNLLFERRSDTVGIN